MSEFDSKFTINIHKMDDGYLAVADWHDARNLSLPDIWGSGKTKYEALASLLADLTEFGEA